MKTYISIFFTLLFCIFNIAYLQAQSSTDYVTVCDGCYPDLLPLCPITGNSPFELTGVLGGHTVSVLNVSEDADQIPNPIISDNDNDWSDLAPIELPAVDALLTLKVAIDLFNELGRIFLVNDTEIHIDAEPLSQFGNGPYAGSGSNGPDIVSIPNVDIENTVNPKVLGHEFAHLYLNENVSQLQTVISNESNGIYEFLADMIGIFIESESTDTPLDWMCTDRNHAIVPSIPYSDPGWNTQGPHIMGTTGGYWFYQMINSNCFATDLDFLEFLLWCVDETNAPQVINYPTLREATLMHYFEMLNNNGNQLSCSDCYIQMVNAWANVGVGSSYNPQTPELIASNVGECSVLVEWEDQGVPLFTVTLWNTDANGNLTSVIGPAEEVIHSLSYNFCTSSLVSGSYALQIEPGFDGECTISNGIIPLIVNFDIDNTNQNPNTAQAFATNCDLVIEMEDVGLNETDFSFTYENLNLIPTQVFRNDGLINFYFDEPFGSNNNGFTVGENITVSITNICDPTNIVVNNFTITINEHIELLLNYEIADPVNHSNCYVFPDINFNFTRFDHLRGRISRITEGEYDEFIDRNSGESGDFENAENSLLLEQAIVFQQFGPIVPTMEIPYDEDQDAELPQYFAINLQGEHQLRNPNHPYFPAQYCSTLFNTNIVVFEVNNNTCQNNNVTIFNSDYCIVGQAIEVDVALSQLVENISHLEYRYRLQGSTWSECILSTSNIFTIEDQDLFTENESTCLGRVEIQIRPICGCNSVPCSNWNAPDVFSDTIEICPPPSPAPFTIVHPENTGAAICEGTLTMDFSPVPGVSAYRLFYEVLPNNIIPNEQPRVICNVEPECIIADEDINIPLGDISYGVCPNIFSTIRVSNLDPNQSYRLYLQSLCCTEIGDDLTCDDNVLNNFDESECFLVQDVVPGCSMDVDQILSLTALSDGQSIEVSWSDPTVLEQDYLIEVIPLGICQQGGGFTIDTTFNPGDERVIDISGLFPNTEYQINVRKDCSGYLCGNYTPTIFGIVTTEDIVFETTFSNLCGSAGFISIFLPNGAPAGTSFIVQNNQANSSNPTSTWNSVSNLLTFEITQGGEYTLSLSNCDLVIEEFSISECNSISIQNTDNCILSRNFIVCDDEISSSWEFLDNNIWVDLNNSDTKFFAPQNGVYRYCVENNDCGKICSDEIVIDCYPNFICDETVDFIINADAVPELSYWLDGDMEIGPIPIINGEVTNLTIGISGNLIVDVDVSFVDCNLIFTEGSSIENSSINNITLVFNQTILSPCIDEWEGIMANAGGVIVVENESIIRDAINGITLKEGGNVSLSNSLIENCKVGILSEEDNGQLIINNEAEIVGNNESLNGLLIRNHYSEFNLNSGLLKLGGSFSEAAIELDLGMFSFNNVELENTGQGHGIKLNGMFNLCNLKDVKILNIHGTGSNGIDVVETPGFYDFTNIEINNVMDGNAINFDNIGAQVKIDKCIIKDVVKNGIVIKNCQNRDIDITNTIINSSVNIGIEIINSDLVNIYDDITISDFSNVGISINNSESIIIENAEINNNSNGNTGCLIENNSTDISLRDNAFSGDGIGVESSGSSGLFICGNGFTTEKGLVFDNANMGLNSVIENTYLNNSLNSIEIIETPIGSQEESSRNYFYGNTNADASSLSQNELEISRFYFQTDNEEPLTDPQELFSPTDIDHILTICNEDDFINDVTLDEYTSNDFYDEEGETNPEGDDSPLPPFPNDDGAGIIIVAPNDNINIGLIEQENILNVATNINNGNYNDLEYAQNQLWNAQSYAVTAINTIVTSNSPSISNVLDMVANIPTVSNNTSGSPIISSTIGLSSNPGVNNDPSPFETNPEILSLLASMSSSLQKEVLEIRFSLNEIQEKHNVYFNNLVLGTSTQAGIIGLNETQLGDLSTSLIELYENDDEVFVERVQSLYSESLNLNSADAFEMLQIELLQWELFQILLGDEAIYLEKETELVATSELCAYQFGNPVYYARNLRNRMSGQNVDYTIFDQNCSTEISGRSTKSELNSLMVYPNPAKGESFWIKSTNPIQKIQLWNIQGIHINVKIDSNDDLIRNIDVSNIPPGIYFLNVQAETNEYIEEIIILP